MDAQQVLKVLRPDAEPNVDYWASGETFRWVGAGQAPTMAEMVAAWPAVQAALAADAVARQTADDQQRTGTTEARKAYARMQTIIDGADTATTAQLRAAIKELAGTMQHLIRAAVR